MGTRDEVRSVIQGYFDDEIGEGEPVDASADCFKSGKLDSLGLVSLIGYLEAQFDFEMEQKDFEMSNFASVDSVERLVAGYVL